MTNTQKDEKADMPIEALILSQPKDRYKYSYAAIRWAREIKQTENLPDPIQKLVPRALRELLTGKVSLKDIEKLPVKIKIAPTPPPAPAPTSLSLNVEAAGVEPKSTEEAPKTDAEAEKPKEEK